MDGDVWTEGYLAPGEPLVTYTTASGATVSAPLYDALVAAGLKAGEKPGAATVGSVKAALSALKWVDQRTPCVIAAWLGGAHDEADPKFAFTDNKLSAQYACGVESSIWGTAIAAKASVESLAGIAPKSATLLLSAGTAAAKASAAGQQKQADEQVAKTVSESAAAVVETAKSTLSFAGFGAGAALVVAIIAIIIIYAPKRA